MPKSKYQFKDLVDVDVLQTLTDELYTATGIPSAIITMDGEILTGSGWQRICTEFHRRHPDIERECIASDTAIREAMDAGEPYVMYRCPRGLVDASSPILIEGEHVANVFTGQLFTEPPDAATEDFFREQARRYGLDEAAYIEAFREVPVFPEEKFRPALAFLAKFANLVGSIGLARKREREVADHLRRSEDALRASELRYRTLAESAQDVIFIIDSSLQVRYVNESGARALRSSSDALVGKPLADVFPPDQAEQYSRSIARVCSTGEPFYTESLGSFAGRKVVLGTRLTPLRDEAGEVTSVLGLSRDITERRRAEEALRRTAAELNEAQRVAGVGSWEWIVATNTITWSEGLYRMLGLDPSVPPPGFEGLPPFYEPESWARLAAVVETALTTGAPYELDLEEIRADGVHIWTTTRGEALRGPSGEVVGLRGTVLEITDRRQAELALKEGEQRLREAQRVGGMGSWELDLATGKVMWSEGYCLLMGRDVARSEPTPEEFRDLYTPESWERLMAATDLAARTGVGYELELEGFREHGERWWQAARGEAVRSPTGEIVRLRGTVLDITERKRRDEVDASRLHLVQFSLTHSVDEILEEALNEAERLTGSHIGVSRFMEDDEEDLTLQSWSTRTRAQFRTSPGTGADDPMPEAEVWADCIRGRRPVIHNDYASLPHHRWLPEGRANVVRGLMVPVIRGGLVKAMVGVGNKPTDYTEADVHAVSLLADTAWDAVERARAEEARRLFLELLEASPAMITVHDENGRFLWINQGALDLHGYTREELLALGLPGLDVPESAALIGERMRQLQRDGQAAFEVGHYRKDRSVMPVWVQARVARWGGRDVVLSVGTDLTERRRSEESARQLERLLRDSQKAEAVLTLAGGIAHDFNNLLTVVICNADLAAKNLHPGSPITANLQAVVAGASRAAELTEQLLAYTGGSPGVPTRVNLSELAREAVGTMRAALPLSARIKLELADDVPAIECDSTDLHRVLVNLLVNASEALGETAGVIHVRTGVVPRDPEASPAAPGPASAARPMDVFLEVEDTGCGMDAETQERIFEPFFSTKFLGRGLGLAATAGIIRAHGGTVSVRSAVGKGSTFRVQFAAAGQSPAESARGGAAAWRGHGTVLVIDDQPAIRKVAAEMLVQHGFKVISAGDGEEGLHEFDAHREEVVVVLLDLVMPRMHGARTLEELRNRAPEVPVVILTGLPSESRKLAMSSHLAVPLLRKPFTMEALVEKVREAMGEAAVPAAT